MGVVGGRGQTVEVASNQCTSVSFHINQTNHVQHMANIMFDRVMIKESEIKKKVSPQNFSI